MDSESCKLFMHVGGSLMEEPLRYVGGTILQWTVDPNNLSNESFCALVTAAGYRAVKHFCYVEPGLHFRDGLRVSYDGVSYCRMLNHMKTLNSMHIYVKHYVTEPCLEDLVVEDSFDGMEENAVSGGDENSYDSDPCRGDVGRSVFADLSDIAGINLLKLPPHGVAKVLSEIRKNKGKLLENAPDLWDVDGDSSDCIDSDDPADEVVESDGEVVFKRTNYTLWDPLETVVRLELGMVFDDTKQFRYALSKYCIQKHFDIEYEKNNRFVVAAHCKADFCPFNIVAGIDNSDGTFKIRILEREHECSKVFKNSRANYKYLGEEFMPKLRILLGLSLDAMHNFAKEYLELDVSRSTLGRAKRWALEQINGKVTEEFNRLFDYVKELRTVDPDGNFELMVERASPESPINFRRLYIGFSNLRKGFRKLCRSIISLDGCFLKGDWDGEILCAVGRDGNEHIWPIAWAVVEKENKESWGWFLTNLGTDLELGEGEGFTLMTDQQKGLKEEIKALLPKVEHRVCARHLYANWKVKYPGNDMRKAFWACAKSTTQPVYEVNLQGLKARDPTSVTQLLKTEPKQWCMAFFQTRSQSDALTNNHAESFNAAIKPARGCSILTMAEAMRKYSMDRILKYMKKMMKWGTVFTPTVEDQLKANKNISAKCHVRWNGGETFEIECRGIQHVVHLNRWTCSCRNWDLTGIPCGNAIASIQWKKRKPEDYVARCYRTDVFKELYTNYPVPGVQSADFWKRTNIGPIEPPIRTPMPGRKKTKRIKEPGEVISKDGTRLTRQRFKSKCSTCKQHGHNKTSCPQTNKAPDVNQTANNQQGETIQVQPQQQRQSINDIPEDLFTLYPTRNSPLNEPMSEIEEPEHASSSPTQTTTVLAPEEITYTVYAPREPKPKNKKKKQNLNAFSSSQPNPATNTASACLPTHSSQPSSSTVQIMSKLSSRGKDILGNSGFVIQPMETHNEGSNLKKRKGNAGNLPAKVKKPSKQPKQPTSTKGKPTWRY